MIPLTDLKVLVLDCQATLADPSKGHLLEIGWALTSASDPTSPQVRTFLLEAPAEEIPSSVSRVTGITKEDLEEGLSPTEVWELLEADSMEIRVEQSPTAIIHYARFERPYLHDLSKRARGTQTLPFQILCTHQIVKRLLPQLPRKGLRAVAGYLGHSIPELRRSRHHVLATVCVWKHIALSLKRHHNVRNLEDLLAWLQSDHTATGSREYPMVSSARLSLPDKPGVYRMLRSNGDLLYVGKASSLRRRVNSYFQRRRRTAEHILEMLTQARTLEFTVTPTRLEAALLEADEIGMLSPPYNVALRQRDRDLVFTSRDFRRISDKPLIRSDLGPLPRRVTTALSDIIALLDSREDLTGEHLEKWRVYSSSKEAVDPDSLKAGWDLFKRKYAEELSVPSQKLFQVGTQIWMNRECKSQEENHLNKVSNQVQEQKICWTPERVLHLLENRVMIAVQWGRRVRWFDLLSNSSVAWKPVEYQNESRVLLVLRAGLIINREILHPGDQIPVSSGYKADHPMQRLEQTDAAILNRLGVLTGELRRLVREGRNVRVRLSPGLTLATERLAQLLQWV